MRAIDRFILHVAHNLFPLNEYSAGVMNQIVNHYRDEADDLNINITDEQLKKYIERFDSIKQGLIAKGGTDLIKPATGGKLEVIIPLSKLIKIVTSSPGAELPNEDKEDDTPDVVYNDNGITIWNGAKQGNCIVYGASQKMPGGLQWCITQSGASWWGRYRYGEGYGNPTFYLAKNNNLSDSDILSFVAIQVLKDGDYKFTNRANNPGSEGPFSWDELNRRVPWLRDIPNLKNILKHIPFSKSEKEGEAFKTKPLSINQWMKESFNTKKQYLLSRAGMSLFDNISNEQFISKYLPKYPQIASVIARTEGIIGVGTLIKYLDIFSKQDQTSIAKQIRDKFDLDILKDDVSFDLKKYLVKTNKVETDPEQRLYVTKDGKAIVLLTFGDGDVKVGLYTEEDNYPSIKLNQRTSKYLLDYPDLDKVPLRNLLKLAEDNVISKEFIDSVLNKAKEDPNSALIVKSVEDGEIILDSNTFSAYKVGSNGKIISVPFDDEEVQQIFNDARDNEGFQQNALNLFKTSKDLPRDIDKASLASVINSIPYNQRTIDDRGVPVVLLTNIEANTPFFTVNSNLEGPFYNVKFVYKRDGNYYQYGSLDADKIPAYHAYLRSVNKSFNDQELLNILGSSNINYEGKEAAVRDGMPVNADNIYKPVMYNDGAVLVNTNNSRESKMLSISRNNLKNLNISQAEANRLLGVQAQPAAAAAAQPAAGDQARRRGRPAGVPNAPRQQQAQPVAAGDLSLSTVANQWGLTPGFNSLPRTILRKFRTNGRQVPVANNRGASARNNTLGNRGRVTTVYEFGPSAIYIIRVPNDGPEGQRPPIASIVAQPGNYHYIVTNNNAYPLGSPRELLQVLQQRNLAENIRKAAVKMYLAENPNMLGETTDMIKKLIKIKNNETK
jgi:hypothetical protein